VAVSRLGIDSTYVDCDVEEPNGHIFLKPTIEECWPVSIPVPAVDENGCTGCGRCDEVCQYSAIVCINNKVLLFPELCHGCGGCSRFCPENVITERGREIGSVERGASNGVRVVQGRLKVGEALSPPVIRAVKKGIPSEGIAVLDSPPGTSCPVIEATKESDFVLLVTEPTPFGLNDLKLAVSMTRELGLPTGLVINRCDVGDEGVEEYCSKEGIRVFLKIPDDKRVAKAYSRGDLLLNTVPGYEKGLSSLFVEIAKEMGQ
jgi:MinD superfamily P-loop ATPase